MKKISKLAIGLLLSVSVLAGGCKNPSENSGNSGNGGTGEIDFWSASTAETVLLDKAKSNYDAVAQEARVDIQMAQNEYEGAQFFMTPSEDVKEYFVEAGDLKNENGTVLPSENIDVYVYKYINVTSSTAARGFGIGYYPDAILPIEDGEAKEE